MKLNRFFLIGSCLFAALFALAWQETKTEKVSDPAALQFLKKVDQTMFNYPAAGVHQLTMKMLVGNNPMMPAESREKLKDLAIVYHWRQEPWAEAVEVVGLPAEMAGMQAQMNQQPTSIRNLVAHSLELIAQHYTVEMSKEEALVVLSFLPKVGEKYFHAFTAWYSEDGRLQKIKHLEPTNHKEAIIEYALTPIGTKWLASELKQSGEAGEGKVAYAYDKVEDLPVLTLITISAGPIVTKIPIKVTINPDLDPKIFESKQ